jgi:hypothetical protein
MEEIGDGVALTLLATKMATEAIARARTTTDKALNGATYKDYPLYGTFNPPTHESQVKLK